MKSLLLGCSMLLMAGCSGGSSAGKAFAKAIDDEQPKEKMPPVAFAKPAATDPAAESAIANLILAHTKNAPSALAAFKTCIVKRTGEMNAGNAMLPATFTDRIQWPDNYRAEWQMNAVPVMTLASRGSTHWQHSPQAGGAATPIKPEMLPSVIADRDATLLTLLVPLLEGDRVAMMVPVTDMPAGLTGVRLWVRSMAPMVLGIDAKTGLLSRIYFEKTEFGPTATWRYHLSNHAESHGVLMPMKITYSAGAKIGAEWSKIEYEVPKAIDAAVFEKP